MSTHDERYQIVVHARRARVVVTSLLLLCQALPTFADDDHKVLSLHGFGTLGLVHSSEDEADFVNNALQPEGPGHSAEWSAEVDSRIGVQVNAKFTERFSAVVQVISEQGHDDRYTPHVEWANLKYEISPDTDIRIGRTVLGSFLVSDHRKVGFSNHWVRPPVELYGLVPLELAPVV